VGSLERYQFQDWRNHAVNLGGDDFLSAVYSRPGEAYILLANLRPKAREAVCRIDPRAFQNPMASVRSAAIVDKEKANPLDVENLIGRGENILLPADGVKLLHLT
jgi:hypothetical protein